MKKAVKSVVAGVTLRDWFAGQALGAIVTAIGALDASLTSGVCVEDLSASWAYDWADAMMRQRGNGVAKEA